jgi:ribosomal protein S6--L-glutamate ligase
MDAGAHDLTFGNPERQQPVNIGILTVHGFGFHPNGRLQAAARTAGHSAQLINPHQVICSLEKQHPGMKGLFLDSASTGEAFGTTPPGKSAAFIGDISNTPIPNGSVPAGTKPPGNSDDFLKNRICGILPDVVMPRQGSPMGEYGFVVLRQLQAMGILLVNGLEGVTIARHQFVTLQTLSAAGIRVPDSCFVTRSGSFFAAVDQLGGYPVVVKQPSGMGGEGVVKIDDRSGAKTCVANMLDPVKGLVVQRFFSPKARVDARILVIGGKVAAAVQLIPAPHDFRTNIHQNGQAKGFDPPPEWADLAVSAARACSLDIAGIDMMVEKEGLPHVVEVNYSPGFRGLEAATGKDIAKKIIAHVLSKAEKFQSGMRKNSL